MNLPDIRRLVTADDVKGRSRIIEDAPATAIRTVSGRPDYRAVNVWRTAESPARIEAKDGTSEHHGILPPRACTARKRSTMPSCWRARSTP